jgi:hypothetical protein
LPRSRTISSFSRRRSKTNFLPLGDKLIITHFRKFFNKNEFEKFTALAADSLALLQKEKAPFEVFVIDEFRQRHNRARLQ